MAEPAILRAEYEALKERASETLKQGKLHEALGLFDEANELARRLGVPDLVDLAFCNRSAVSIRLHQGEDCVPKLRQMLLRTTNPQVARHSAYNLALACDAQKNYNKELFYARIAYRYSVELAEVEHEASALNQIGNALVALNDFGGALEEYRRADRLLESEQSGRKAIILANLGYCCLLTDQPVDGFRALVRGLRMARRVGAPLAESLARLCLAFAHLLHGRPWYALRHGSEALELAEAHGDEQTLKYALLLLGEAYKQGGKMNVARECFELLQRTYYPGMAQVPEMLLGVDVCRVINLRA
jgi:tetratricopeptide (TPR) repeat protein